jgi:hypothetical protein
MHLLSTQDVLYLLSISELHIYWILPNMKLMYPLNIALCYICFVIYVYRGLNKSNNKIEEGKTDSQKDFEEQLREQVKQSLKKIAETTPPITEDSCSQFENSSAANSNGFGKYGIGIF